jgi:membrane protein YqaA with SNARE-associated domain
MLEKLGLFGLFLGCVLSATIVPFSSEALVSGASLLGYNVWVVVIVASIGNTLGGMISFGMGWLCKWEWLEKYFRVKREKIEKAHKKVEHYGYIAALFAWLPIVGDLIAIAMGFIRMNPYITTGLMFVGKFVRYLVVVGIINLAFL